METILDEWYNSLQGAKSSNFESLLPSALQLYHLGILLHRLSTLHDNRQWSNVRNAYHALMQTVPANYTKHVLADLSDSLTSVLQDATSTGSTITDTWHEGVSGLQSISELYDGSQVAQEVACDCWSIEQLSVLINVNDSNGDKRNPASANVDRYIITILCAYLLSVSDFELMLPFLDVVRQNSTLWEKMVDRLVSLYDQRWKSLVTRRFTDESQLEYLASLLDDGRPGPNTLPPTRPNTIGVDRAKPGRIQSIKVSPEQEIQRRIDRVRAVLPHLGEGFVEMALSHWRANVEETVAKLLESDESHWPIQLRVTDRNLPRRHDKNAGSTLAAEEAEAKEIAKVAIRAAADQAEYEARMVATVMSLDERKGASDKRTVRHDEYDDDYDDQYDDLDGFGNADGGLYDDYEAVLVYNRVAKQEEAEMLYWEQSRSSNRSPGPRNHERDDQSQLLPETSERKYRGPDKMRGGRIPGRHGGRSGLGGRHGNQSTNNSNGDQTVPNSTGRPSANAPADASSNASGAKPNLRQKERHLGKRRDQQKKAAVHRTGA
jgi:hypothetical protein